MVLHTENMEYGALCEHADPRSVHSLHVWQMEMENAKR